MTGRAILGNLVQALGRMAMAKGERKWVRNGGPPDFVTNYAMTSPEEDAAEMGAAYVTNTLKLWKVAITQNSPALLEKAKIIEEMFVHDGKHHYSSDGAMFDVPADQAPAFFDRACALIRQGKALAEIEALLLEEYKDFVSGPGLSKPAASKTYLRRLRSALTFGLLTTATLVALLGFGSMAAVKGVYTSYFFISLLFLPALQVLSSYGYGLESEYSDVHFYRVSGISIGLLVLIALSCLGGGWLLSHGYRTAFRFAASIPSVLIATIGARWLLAAPDARDESGHLKFGTRSALIGLFLALVSFGFTVASILISEVFPK
jgi:Putative zinc-binding metallo-peptidase